MAVGLPHRQFLLKVIVLLSMCWICGQDPQRILSLEMDEAIDFRQFWEFGGAKAQTVET